MTAARAGHGFTADRSDQDQATSPAISVDDDQAQNKPGHSPTDSIHTVGSEATTLWSPTGRPSFEKKATDDEDDAHSNATSEEDRFLGTSNERSPIDQPITPVIEEESQKFPPKRKTASWHELPRKGQLALLMISRLSEPLTQTSLQSYMFYQLKSFDSSLPDSTISAQAGWMAAGFTGAQFCTAFLWGRAADSELLGRKKVVLIGLFGTMISALGFGFSSSFMVAMLFRCIGGALNGNVGVMRVMISEIIKEKRFQSRAFMMLPMTFNIGVIIGPILGGLLSDPVTQYPHIFGPGGVLGGKDGVWWMKRWPYALPNIVSAILLFTAVIALFLGLDETHEVLRYKPDPGRKIARWLSRMCCRRTGSHPYSVVPTDDGPDTSIAQIQLHRTTSRTMQQSTKLGQKLPFRRIFTKNVLITLSSHGLLASHVGTFNSLWFILLSTPRFDPAHPSPPEHTHQQLPFRFTGGMSMPPAQIGLALSILGFIGISLQLLLYPKLSARLGTTLSYRLSLLLFPIAYFLAPYIVLLPSSTKPPTPSDGPLVWIGITLVLSVQVFARTFALPGVTILVNNCCPHPSVLGTIHGLGTSVSSGARTFGPAIAGWMYGKGLNMGVVGLAWWGMAIDAIVGCFVGVFVKEGSGHEILLEGEEEEENLMERR